MFLLIHPAAYAANNWFGVHQIYTDYFFMLYSNEPFLAPTYQPQARFDLHVDLDFANGWLFWDNMVHSETDSAQYRLIGWNYKIGAHIFKWGDVYLEHFSQHLLDVVPARPNNYQAIVIRFYLYRSDR